MQAAEFGVGESSQIELVDWLGIIGTTRRRVANFRTSKIV
jgi:hypothetical protein